MQSRQKELESKLEEKQKDIERLEKMLELIKTECNAQVSEKVRASSAESGLHYLLLHAPFLLEIVEIEIEFNFLNCMLIPALLCLSNLNLLLWTNNRKAFEKLILTNYNLYEFEQLMQRVSEHRLDLSTLVITELSSLGFNITVSSYKIT